MGKPVRLKSTATAPIGAEVGLALDMIRDGKSDGAIAAQLTAARPHGQFRIDPEHIAQLRKGA